MWFLECEGDLFENKRIWLRPGTKLVIGRTSKPEPGQRMRYIENSSVSRKHLTVDIAQVEAGESKHLHAKTKIIVTDNSKVGTWVHGEKLRKGESQPLDRNDNKIRLGNYEQMFHIKWQPIVFSFPSLPRASRQLEDPLAEQRQFLEPLGIKCVVDYIAQFTSHLVAKKRNTPTTLQALVNARYIVTDEYLKEVQSMSLEALEQDFAANWPSEEPYSPPPANEPNPRPNKSPDFLPNSKRSEMFSQYTFIFSDPGQHANLMPTITGGGGKALCHEVDSQNPDAEDLMSYVREVAGKKSDRGFKLNQQPKSKGGIILVRIGGFKDYMPNFYDRVDSALDQSSIEQNELLEAILDADADKLKRPAEVSHIAEDPNMENRAQSSAVRQGSQSPSVRRQSRRIATEAPSATPESATPEVSQQEPTTTKRRGRKPLTQTKFKGFDEIDINALPKYRSPSPSQPPSYEASQIPSPDAMDNASHPASSHPVPSQHTQRSTRKRPPPEDEETHQDMMTDMLQGAAKMKRRRIEQGLETSTTPAETPVEAPTPAPAIVKAKKRKDKEVDVRAILAERQQAEEERRLEDEEKLRNQLPGMEVADMKNLAQIEEMEIRREPPPRSRHDAEAGHDDRWDDRWNGRKNFKKFRRQGNAANTQTRARVFVSLEEVAPKAYGAQDDYFLESSSIRSKKSQKKAKRSQQTQDSVDVQVTATPASTSGKGTQSQRQKNNANSISLVSDSDNDKSSEDEDNASRFRRRIATSRRQDAEASRSEAIMQEEIAGTARDQDIADAARQAKSSASVRTQPGKRTAKGVVDEVSQPRKRVQRKPSPDEVSEDEDDEEEASTRFRRRKR
ncbi:hypothetical protein D6D17_05770 [Aureobasidium pullulans]|nr:hypothetical protein D6D17_05770 [Aureobasidium pullulans]